MKPSRPLTLAIHWEQFGPYHIARLQAAFETLQRQHVRVVGVETATWTDTYLWKPIDDELPFERYVAFPDRQAQNLPSLAKWQGIWRLLDRLQPDMMAIPGFSTADALGALAWCRVHGRPTILMSESKWDDRQRFAWKEWVKARIVALYAAALCGGTPQKAYIERLGMNPDRVFAGYDVVDNGYFAVNSDQVRQDPARVSHLPGLANLAPFFLASSRFIKRKNMALLIRAYSTYKQYHALSNPSQPLWRLIILGDGEERPSLQALIAEEGLQDDVVLAGFRQIDELPAYYGRAGVFVHPPLVEQWGLVVNEALAAGLPVLVSKTTGCSTDLVVEGVNGFLFDPESVDDLSALLIKVSSGQVDLAGMSKAARQHIAQWGPERFADGLTQAVHASLAR